MIFRFINTQTMNIKNHRLLEDVSCELHKIIKDYDVCKKLGIEYLTIKEYEHQENTRKYHHKCIKNLANNIPNDTIPWSYYIPFTQINDNEFTSYEILCAHMNKKDNYKVYLKIIASKQGIRVLGDIVCGAIGIEYFKENLNLKDKIDELNNMRYHMLISCYNNIVLD